MAAAAGMMFRFVVLLALCSLASVALLRGSYVPKELVASPGFSRLLQVSSLFVRDITVRTEEEEGGSGGEKNGLVLYGLAGAPRLLSAPARARRIVVMPASSHREWVYFLNRGSQIEVDYSVETGAELIYPLHIIIAQGKESFTEWTANPSVHNATLSWRMVHGIGTVKQSIVSSSDYYFAVGNLNDQNITVTLDFRIRAVFYDTTGADYACSPARDSPCTYSLPILGHNAVVLSSGSAIKQRPDSDDEQHVKGKLSYGPRWIVFVTGSTILAVVLLLLYEVMSALLGCCNAGGSAGGTSGSGADDQRRASLLAGSKEGGEASLGSSYDSVSDDGGEDVEGGRNDEEGRRLCVVCCDARKDCFFLPCGHSATCHACGTRVLEEGDGSCPFCRRKLKKVRRIFAV